MLGGLVAKVHWGGDPYAAWRWTFVAVGILALIGAGVACTAQNSSAPEGRSLDWPGQITIAVALFALLFAVISAATSGWSDGLVISGFVVAAIFLLLFIAAERRFDAPLLRLDLFRSRPFAVKSGPLGANGVPATVPGPKGVPVPFNPLKDAAFHALGQAYSLGYLICGVAALVAAVLAAAALHGLAHRPLVTEESLAE